ncbi:MAG: permease [Planctomycetota bacterium]
MNLKTEWKTFLFIIVIFLACFYLPVEAARFTTALFEALYLVKSYAREHVLLCLVPAFFMAGAISVFISQASVMKYLGARANKVTAYAVASVSGSILAVCSCTVLPLFAGIYKMGAGLGPATAFLYSGPAINILAIILTARVLGLEIGIARGIGAILFSIIIGLIMHLLFREEERQKSDSQANMSEVQAARPLWQNAIYFASMVGILVFANWSYPAKDNGLWCYIYLHKWLITGCFAISFAVIAVMITSKKDACQWLEATWIFSKQILPLLLLGVFIAGMLLGRPGHEGLIPSAWVANIIGGNTIRANFFAAAAGALMYFATLTEIPIVQGLMSSGMGKGPALALLLAGPALSLPNMLVIRSVMGTKKTMVFITLVIVMATTSGIVFGTFFQGTQS